MGRAPRAPPLDSPLCERGDISQGNPRRAFVADVAGTTFVLLDIVLRTGKKPMPTRYQQLENKIIAFT